MRPRWMTTVYEMARDIARELLTPPPVMQHEPWQRVRYELPEPAIHVQATGAMMPLAGGRPWYGPPGSLVAVSQGQPPRRHRETGALPMLPAPQQTGAHRRLRPIRIEEVPTDRQLRRETTPADEQAYVEAEVLISRVSTPADFAENDWLNDPLPPILPPLATDALACSDKLTLPPGQVSDALSELAAQQPDEDTVEVPAFMRRKHTKESE